MLAEFDAVGLSAAVQSGGLSPVEVVDAAAERIAALDDELHAFCTLTLDSAREAARRLADRIARGEPVGPLAGVPVAIKDLISTAGVVTVAGSAAYRGFVPDEDDIVVERIRAADGLIVGKTNVSEFGYGAVGHNPVFATTRNPWNPELTSGGSSAGSAVAVRTGMSVVALGSDGGGSIRIPAALSGVVGMKASMGRVPLYPGCRDERYPGLSGWDSLEHLGPLTRSVADAALVLSVIAGPDPRDRHSIPTLDVDWTGGLRDGRDRLHGLRVAYCEGWPGLPVEPEVCRVVRRAVDVFAGELGCHVVEIEAPWADPSPTFTALVAVETDLRGLRALVEEYGAQLSPQVIEVAARSWRDEELTDAITARKALTNRMWRLMRDFDLLLTPTSAVTAFETGVLGPDHIDGRPVGIDAWTAFTCLANLTGQPAVSVPAGLSADGLPVGLQIIGRHLADSAVLQAAAAYEAVAAFPAWRALERGVR